MLFLLAVWLLKNAQVTKNLLLISRYQDDLTDLLQLFNNMPVKLTSCDKSIASSKSSIAVNIFYVD